MHFDRSKRRKFISLLGGAVTTWPLAARAQQPAIPTVGILSDLPSSYITSRMPPFRQGLNESGYIEGRNVAIEYRLACGR
jgi:putative ABC transport system substrate-binding protein